MKVQQVAALAVGKSSRDRRTIETGANSRPQLFDRVMNTSARSPRSCLALGQPR